MGVFFGRFLQRQRQEYGLTLDQAARRFGIPRRRLLAMEAGDVWPQWEEYERINRTFGWEPTTERAPD